MRRSATVTNIRQTPKTAKSRQKRGTNSPPRRRPNAELRQREYLTPDEVAALEKHAGTRHKVRDRAIIHVMYRHGLRVSELTALRWDQVDLKRGLLHVKRLKNGVDSVQPLRGPTLRQLRAVKREYPGSPYVFVSERGGPLTTRAVRIIVAQAGEAAKLGFPVHPHMLRHACGYKLANDGVDTRALQQYLGHANIQHTVRYTELRADRFKNFWKD